MMPPREALTSSDGHIEHRQHHVASQLTPKLRLTPHAVGIILRLSRGSPAKEIARQLGLAVHTVYEEIGFIRRRLQARNLPELIRLAILHGFIQP